jgi:tetratricopeptide (TPR) repeat protein
MRQRLITGCGTAIAAIALTGFPFANATESSRKDVPQSGASAQVLHDQGMVLLRQGDARAAVPKFRAAAALDPMQWNLLEPLIDACIRTGEFGGRHDLAGYKAEHLRKRLGNLLNPTRARAVELNDMGVIYTKIEMSAAAERCFQAAIALHEKLNDRVEQSRTLDNLAGLYVATGDYAKAEPLYRRVLETREKTTGPQNPSTARSLNDLAAVYKAMGDYAKAEPFLQRALAIREKALGPEHPDTAYSLNALADIYLQRGEYGKAEPLYERALRISEKTLGREHASTGTSLNNLAWLYYKIGSYAKAEPLYRRALAISEKMAGREHPDTAKILSNLALLYADTADYAKAEPLNKRALKIFEEKLGPENRYTGVSLNNLAGLYSSIGDYAKAEPLYQRALAISEKTFGLNHPETARSLQNLAGLYWSMGDYSKVEPLYRRTFEVWERTLGPDHPDTAIAIGNLAGVYDSQGDYAKAEPLRLRALAITEKALGPDAPETAHRLNNLAWHYWKMGQAGKAEPLFLRALHIRERAVPPTYSAMAESLGNVACVKIDLGQREEAILFAERAMHAEEAVLANILSFTTEQQRFEFLRTQRPYSLLATLQAAASMAQAILRRKGIVLDSLLEDRLVAEASGDPKQRLILEELRSAKQRLTKLQLEGPKDLSDQARKQAAAEKEKLSSRVEQLESGLARQVAGLGKARRALSVTVAQVQSVVPKQATLVELLCYNHYLGKDKWELRYGAIVIAPTGEPKWVPLGSAAEIEKNVGLYQKSVRGKTDEATLSTVLKALAEQAWAPIEKALAAGTTTVIVSPDAELSFVSFATLLTPDDRFVGEKYFIRYVASGRDLLRETKPAADAKTSIRVFADPDFAAKGDGATLAEEKTNEVALRSTEMRDLQSISLPELPGTARESEKLEERAKKAGWQANLSLCEYATEAELRKVSSPRILHLATHGFFLPEIDLGTPKGAIDGSEIPKGKLVNPMHRSGLAMAGAQTTLHAWAEGEVPPTENDGIVTAEEVGGLKLDGTWLVVLSACDTGGGEAKAGEGVMGLRRGFVQAGAQNLLMTLWPISDETTVQIMLDFYDAAFKSGNAPQALEDTQREWLVKLRKERGLLPAVQLAGPFIMSSQGKQ